MSMASCPACDTIPPCPPCTSRQICLQQYPDACHTCPQNVCVDMPTSTHIIAVVGGTTGGVLGLLLLVCGCIWAWHQSSKSRHRVSVPGTRLDLSTRPAPEAPPASPIFAPSRRAPPLWRISELTEPMSSSIHALADAHRRPSDAERESAPSTGSTLTMMGIARTTSWTSVLPYITGTTKNSEVSESLS
ncbi:hypothetical protein ACI68E_003154 [Malassezia pachydermatis]